jgi:hypothetical protein
MDERMHTVKQNAEALLVAGRRIGLEANAVKTMYTSKSRGYSAGRNHGM